MTRVLYLTYFFPPIGGAGAQRSAKYARHLPGLGFDVTVITGPGRPTYRWTPTDPSLGSELESAVTIHRLAPPEPARSGGWRGRAERWGRLRSPWERWWTEGVVELAERVGGASDLVYAALAPFGTAAAAQAAAELLDKPLVVDLEDPWALDEMMVYPTSVHRRLERRRMRAALASADAIVMNTDEAASRVRAEFPELARRRGVFAIPNGYDDQDYTPEPQPLTRHDGVFRIVHTGTLHTDLGLRHRRMRRVRRLLGGATGGLDILTRSHVFLLQAVRAVIERRPELASALEVHLVGQLTDEDRSVSRGATFVREHGFLSHSDTTALMRTADLLFLPMHDVPAGQRVAIVPCKTYDYLAARRPILAAVPDGDARDLLVAAGNAWICRPSDVEAMAHAIEDALAWRGETREPDERVLAALAPGALTDRLAEVLEETAAGRRESSATAAGQPRG